MTATQNQRVLAALADGEWHTATEIHRAAGFMRLNSRVAELRSRGHLIEHRGGGAGPDAHEYRLSPLEAGASAAAPIPAPASSGAGQSSPPVGARPVESQPAPLTQLELAGV